VSSGSYSKLIQIKMKLFYKSKCFNSADKTIDMLLSLDKVAYSKFIKKWVLQGPTHHYALGIGHHAETIAKIADVLGIESVIVK